MLTSILSTKLYIPKIRDNNVMRKTLVDKMAGIIGGNSKVTLVSAPAGYGKTTLVSELIGYMGLKSAWVSLDEGDNDLVRFLSYIAAALKGVGVGMESDTETLLSDLNLSSNQSIATMIINDIIDYSNKVILVLDDFHLISSTQVNDTVKFLIEHQPSNFHIIIISREDPHLPLSRLRALGRLNEVRVDDLRFSRDEVEEFLKVTMGLNIGFKGVEAFNAKTEGWVAGLQLAGLSLRGLDEQAIDDFISEFNGTHRYIIDYLVEEVLQHQKREVRDFLCKTSILHRMNGELCDALIEGKGSRAILQELEQDNLFIIPLDGKREWYRYHHLFQDSLRAELAKEEEQLLHKRASLWFENNGFKQEAVRHGIESGDMDLALRLIVDNTEEMFARAQLHTLVNWMEALPEKIIRGNEILCIRKAWALFIIGRMKDAAEYLDSLGEEFLEKTTHHNKGLALSLRAVISQYTGRGRSEELAGEALGLLESWDPISRVSTLNTLGRAQENSGKINEASETFKIAYAEGQRLGYAFVTTLALMNLGTSLNTLGKRKEAIELYTRYIDGMNLRFGKLLPYVGVVYINLAASYYDGNELESASFYINKGIELCNSISYNWTQSSEILASRIEYAVGNKDSAISTIEKAINAYIEKKQEITALKSISVVVEVLLRNGNGEKAVEYEQRLIDYLEKADSVFNEDVYIAYIRILIYRKKFSEAFELLKRVSLEMENRRKVRTLITVYILYARACYDSMDYEEAEQYTHKALSLAGEGEYYRMLLDEEPFIYCAANYIDKAEGSFKEKLLGYMGLIETKHGLKPKVEISSLAGIGSKSAKDPEYIEKLSQREIDILKLLGKGLTNSEISSRLYISINTTQWHISHIYSKLNVKNRTQAILKAEELEII